MDKNFFSLWFCEAQISDYNASLPNCNLYDGSPIIDIDYLSIKINVAFYEHNIVRNVNISFKPIITEEKKQRIKDWYRRNYIEILKYRSNLTSFEDIKLYLTEVLSDISINFSYIDDLTFDYNLQDVILDPLALWKCILKNTIDIFDNDPLLFDKLIGLDLEQELKEYIQDFYIKQIFGNNLLSYSQINDLYGYQYNEGNIDTLSSLLDYPIPNLRAKNISSFIVAHCKNYSYYYDNICKLIKKSSTVAKQSLLSDIPKKFSYNPEKIIIFIDRSGYCLLESECTRKGFSRSSDALRCIDCSINNKEYCGWSFPSHLFTAANINTDEYRNNHVIRMLVDLWFIASSLVRGAAIMPRYYLSDQDEEEQNSHSTKVSVTWVPATIIPSIRELTTKVGQILKSDCKLLVVNEIDLNPLLLGETVLGIFISDYVYFSSRYYSSYSRCFVSRTYSSYDMYYDTELMNSARGILSLQLYDYSYRLVILLSPYEGVRTDTDLDYLGNPLVDDEIFEVSIGYENVLHNSEIVYIKNLDELYNSSIDEEKISNCIKQWEHFKLYGTNQIKLLMTGDYHQKKFLQSRGFQDFYENVVEYAKLCGINFIMDKALSNILSPQKSLGLKLKGAWNYSSGLLGLTQLLDYNWKLSIGDQEISENEFSDLCSHMGSLIKYGEGYVYVDPKVFGSMLDAVSKSKYKVPKSRLLAIALSRQKETEEAVVDEEILKSLDVLLKDQEIILPKDNVAELRPYQERGYKWLMRNVNINLGSIIADDMGLGKTLQVITVLLKLKENGDFNNKQALIVVPTSLIINWQRELNKFAPSLSYNIFYGPNAELNQETDLVLTTYGKLRSCSSIFKKISFRILVVDEAQNIKNHVSLSSVALRTINAEVRIAMSGTPVENHLTDYWSILDFINPSLIGSADSFRREFAIPIEKNRDVKVAELFRTLTSPFILRRLKSDKQVIIDLPEKYTKDMFCSLSKEQAAMYESVISNSLEKIEAAVDAFRRSSFILDMILRLKQVCDSPSLLYDNKQFQDPSFSGKAETLLEILDELAETDQKVLIFTQFRNMGVLIQDWIEHHTKGYRPNFLHGGVSMSQRSIMVDKFQDDPNEKCLILSVKAGGLGLNLTSATAVIHYDLWWNPAVEDQATDRAYRIGQENDVQVFRLICADTFEEKVNQLLQSKRDLADMTVISSESWLGDLSKSEIQQLFSLGKY